MNALLTSLEEERSRRYRRLVAISAAVHVFAFFAFVVVPMPHRAVMAPSVVQVDLVAGPAPARRAPAPPRPKPAPKPQAAPKPEPKPPPPKPPPPKQAEVVLPAKPTQKPKPAPPKPPPKPEEPVKPEPKPAKEQKEISYDALMAQLRKEEHDEPPSQAAEHAPSEGQAARGGGAVVTPEMLAWIRRAKAQVTQSWVLAPGFRTKALQTQIQVTLSANGDVVNTRVTEGSGNPWFDESVERAIQKASPLPAPPDAGDWLFVFRPVDAF
jgi:colicin import membrane protein